MTEEKESKNRNTDQSSRQFGVILEDIDGKLDTLLEGQQGLTVRTDKIEVKAGAVGRDGFKVGDLIVVSH